MGTTTCQMVAKNPYMVLFLLLHYFNQLDCGKIVSQGALFSINFTVLCGQMLRENFLEGF